MLNALNRFGKPDNSGFTLVELIVVVAIIAILAAIAIPQFSEYRKRGYNASAQSDLMNLRTAEEAIYADFTDYGASDNVSHPGTSTTVGAEAGPGALIWLSCGRTTTPPQSSSLSPGVYAVANVFFNGIANTSYTLVTAHGTGNEFYGVDSDATTLYRKNMATGYIAGMALANDPAATFGTDDFAALAPVWIGVQ